MKIIYKQYEMLVDSPTQKIDEVFSSDEPQDSMNSIPAFLVGVASQVTSKIFQAICFDPCEKVVQRKLEITIDY